MVKMQIFTNACMGRSNSLLIAIMFVLPAGCVSLEEIQDRQQRQAELAEKANPIIRAQVEQMCDMTKSEPFKGFGVPEPGRFNTYLRVPCHGLDGIEKVLWFGPTGKLDRVMTMK